MSDVIEIIIVILKIDQLIKLERSRTVILDRGALSWHLLHLFCVSRDADGDESHRDGDEGHWGDLDEVGHAALFLANGGTSVLYIYLDILGATIYMEAHICFNLETLFRCEIVLYLQYRSGL